MWLYSYSLGEFHLRTSVTAPRNHCPVTSIPTRSLAQKLEAILEQPSSCIAVASYIKVGAVVTIFSSIVGCEHRPIDVHIIYFAASCTSGFTTSLDVAARRRQSEQWVFPNIKFTCRGAVTRVVYRATTNSRSGLYPTLQLWSRIATEPDTYIRVRSASLAGALSGDDIFTVDLNSTQLQFERNDVVGVLLPRSGHRLRFRSNASRLLGYYYDIMSNGNPTEDVFRVSEAQEANSLPLITVEISKCVAS